MTDESETAKEYIEFARPEMEHKVVPIYWEDFEECTPLLLAHKGEPTHSIEVQIYKAALQAKADGCEVFIFGETADCIYGGHSQLLSRDWTFGEFVDRWSFVMPHHVLREPMMILDPIKKWKGPIRDEFIPHCTDNMTGDQKWLVWCLELFLNICDY